MHIRGQPTLALDAVGVNTSHALSDAAIQHVAKSNQFQKEGIKTERNREKIAAIETQKRM